MQKLKYLHDQMLLDTNTDIRAKLSVRNPVWMEPRPRYPLKVSLTMLRNTEEGLKAIREFARGKGNSRLRKPGRTTDRRRTDRAEPIVTDGRYK